MIRLCHGIVVALVALFVCPAAAKSRRPAAPVVQDLSATLEGEAKSSYEQARILFGTSDFGGALAQYERAHALQPDPRLLWNMAVCHKQLRHYAKALPLIEAFLEGASDTTSAEEKRQAREFGQALRSLVGTLSLHCDDPQVTVFIDEEPAPEACAQPQLLDGGAHRIRATKAEYQERSDSVVVPGGGTAAWTISLEPRVHQGHLTVRTDLEGYILVDGRGVGPQNWSGTLPVGKHRIDVSAPGKKDFRAEIEVLDGDQRTVVATLEEDDRGVPVWALVLGGAVVAAGATIGTYFALHRGGAAPIDGSLGTHVLTP